MGRRLVDSIHYMVEKDVLLAQRFPYLVVSFLDMDVCTLSSLSHLVPFMCCFTDFGSYAPHKSRLFTLPTTPSFVTLLSHSIIPSTPIHSCCGLWLTAGISKYQVFAWLYFSIDRFYCWSDAR